MNNEECIRDEKKSVCAEVNEVGAEMFLQHTVKETIKGGSLKASSKSVSCACNANWRSKCDVALAIKRGIV